MPDCWDLADDAHHCFPRSQIGNDSWFVAIGPDAGRYAETSIIPHVVGLCREHHDDVEEHRSWIKLLDDSFLWFDRVAADSLEGRLADWELIGALDPQPAKGEKSKKPRLRLRGEERRKRRRISLAVPDDWENGGELWDEMVEDAKEWLFEEGLFGDRGRIPVYEALMGMHAHWVQARQHSPREEIG